MPDNGVILLAEDLENDILLIRRAFERGKLINPLFVVRDGDETICYLKCVGKYSNRAEYPLPDLLLLDLKMPGTDGFEVLRWLRAQPSFRNLLTVVLTASDQIRDVNLAYQLGANSFLVKPLDFDNFVETCRIIKDYWLNLNRTPEISRPASGKSSRAAGSQ